MRRTVSLLIASALAQLPIRAADSLLRDPAFATLGEPGSAWTATPDKDGLAAATPPAGVRLKAARLSQDLTLADGLFELTVQAHGQGELRLGVEGFGERTEGLGKDGGTYGYLFEAKTGPGKIVIGVTLDGTLTAAALLPADDAQRAAWAKAQESLRQFGFVTVSPQRAPPGSATLEFSGEIKPLAGVSRRAVLDEPRLNCAWAKNVERLVQWLGANGFERLDGDRLPEWMDARLRAGDAYGSVVVLPRGKSPVKIFAGPLKEPLWLRYLRAGGRIVHVGDLPLNYAEPTTVEPVSVDTWASGAGLLGLEYGWQSPYWGQGSLAVTPTAAAKAWGIEMLDGSITGMAVERVSLAFGEYTVPNTGRKGAASWFKNVRPDMPWSGLIKIQQHFDAANDTALRDIWRAAHYVGQPVTVPAPPPPLDAGKPPALTVAIVAGGMPDRHEFVRGEDVTLTVTPAPDLKAETVRIELARCSCSRPPIGEARSACTGETNCWKTTPLWSDVRPVTAAAEAKAPAAAGFVLATAPYAYGTYTLRFRAVSGGHDVAQVYDRVGIRYLPPEAFNWEVWHGAGSNPLRSDMEFADIRAAGLELYLVSTDVLGVDTAIRNGLGFSIRAHPEFLPPSRQVTFEKNPEYYRLDNQGKPMGNPYTAGRPGLGISHPEIRANAVHSLEAAVKPVTGIPAFRPYAVCNDDFSIYYGWDYSPHVLAAFKADTGLDAPRKMELPATFGAVPENHPWLRWFEWALLNVDGAFNKAETQGATTARPDVRIGPIPGGMQIPLVSMWEPAQYPPYNFGRNGFNLICSYYYNTYWQPVMTVTFWMEIGRMGNRDLPEWNMPDAFMTAAYTRNNLFHYLAGGVKGLAYFTYDSRNDHTWPEFRRLGQMLRRIGPVQVRLAPARRDIGMLNSFTTNCFDPGHTLIEVYGYHNLIQAHFDVEMVSEDEVVAGRAAQYKAVLLYNVRHLRQTVYDALAAHAANGGLVILDSSVPFDLPGAKRIPVDIGMGTEKTLPMPPEGAHASTPGIRDYGYPERVALIRKALSAHVPPRFDSDDIRLAAWRLEAEGVPYTWFVNVHDGKEYMFCRERMGAGHPGSGTPEKKQEVRDWEAAEEAKGEWTSTVVMDALPGVPFDLVAQRRLDVKATPDRRYALTVRMQRFGGALVAWLPGEPDRPELTSPRAAKPGDPVKVTATVSYARKPLAGALPVQFTLTDPTGAESVVSGVRATTAGVAEFTWTPAVNDPAGKWTLTATELVTGKTAKQTLRLHP